MIRSVLLAAAIAVAVPASLEAAGLPVLTISGTIETANRGPSTTDDHTLLAAQGIVFDRGFTMSLEELAGLPQVERQAVPEGEETKVTYSGPRLVDVLEAAGAMGETVIVNALDSYAPEIPMAMIKQHNPILAISREGTPMPIGGQGPMVIVWPSTGNPDLAEQFRGWAVWAVYHIGVR